MSFVIFKYFVMLPLLLPQAGLAGTGAQRLSCYRTRICTLIYQTQQGYQRNPSGLKGRATVPSLCISQVAVGRQGDGPAWALNLLIFPGRSNLWPTSQINWEDKMWSSLAKGFVWCEGIDKCKYIKGGHITQMRPQDFTLGWGNHFQANAISTTELWEPSFRMPAAGVE